MTPVARQRSRSEVSQVSLPRPTNQSVPNTSGSERLLAVAASLTVCFHRKVKNHFMYTMHVSPKQTAVPRLTAAALAYSR